MTFSAVGLPAGVTAAFNPASTTGTTSVVTFTAAANATTGTATVTITGTGGGLTRTTTIALTVAPAPQLHAQRRPGERDRRAGRDGPEHGDHRPAQRLCRGRGVQRGGPPGGRHGDVRAGVDDRDEQRGDVHGNGQRGARPGDGHDHGDGGLTRTTAIALTVTPAPDFALTVSPAAVTVVQGATAGTTVTIAQLNGFSAPVTFTASGLPAGVSATFAPPTTPGPTTSLTFAAALDAALGPATVTITGTGGGLTRTTTVALTVAPAADFTLAASPAAVTVVLESTATSTESRSRALNGFAAPVSFSAGGLPAGLTATFNPASATDATVVTFAASAAAVPGTTTVTITGVGGGLVRSTTIALTVAAPAGDFSLDASPAGLTVAVGGSATTTISITRTDGFPSTIAFSASGLPSGVVATFTPPATTGDITTLTLTALDTAVTGPATVTITGTGGTLTRTTSVTLLVTPAVVGDFSLAATPAAFTISQGDTVSGTVTITRSNGFADEVGFTADGLPAA